MKENENLDLEEILKNIQGTKFKNENVYVPQFKSNVEIRELNGKDFLDCSLNSDSEDESKGSYLVNAIIKSTYTLNGEKVFNQPEHKDNVLLVNSLQKNSYLLLVNTVTKLNKDITTKN
jgi:hypothetical protein